MERKKLKEMVSNKFGSPFKAAEKIGVNKNAVDDFINGGEQPDTVKNKIMEALSVDKKDESSVLMFDTGLDAQAPDSKKNGEDKGIEPKLIKKEGLHIPAFLNPEKTSTGYIVKARTLRFASHQERRGEVPLSGMVIQRDCYYIATTGISKQSLDGASVLIRDIPNLLIVDGIFINNTPLFIDGELCILFGCFGTTLVRINCGKPIAEVVILNK
jgi:hypothetical protein